LKKFATFLFCFSIILLLFQGCKKDKEDNIDFAIDESKYEKYIFHSDTVGEDYSIYVYVPPSYTQNTTQYYPVLYVLDGDENFRETAGIVEYYAVEKKTTAEAIVIGIGYVNYGNRDRDYTPSNTPDGSGKVENFYRFLETELIPSIEAVYRTDTTATGRGITGHSYGGIATLWGLLYHTNTFSHFLSGSPSLWYGETPGLSAGDTVQHVFFQYESQYAALHTDLSAKLYIGTGTMENGQMGPLTLEFGERLTSRNYPSLNLKYELVEGKEHSTAFIPEMRKGIQFLYAK